MNMGMDPTMWAKSIRMGNRAASVGTSTHPVIQVIKLINYNHSSWLKISVNPEYEGQFEYGIPHGNGTRYESDGTIHEGQFIRGKAHGYGKRTLPNGSVIEGTIIDL